MEKTLLQYFIEENIEIAEGKFRENATLNIFAIYDQYKTWHRENCERIPMPTRFEISDELNKHCSSRNSYYYDGLKFKD